VGSAPVPQAGVTGIEALIAEQTSEAFALLDSQGRVRYANAALARLLGRTTAQLAGSPLPSFFSLPGRTAFRELLRAVAAGAARDPRTPPLSLVVRDAPGAKSAQGGRERSIPVALRLSAAGTAGVLAVIQDRSEQAALLRELQASRASYATLSETVAEPILQINEELKIVFANSAVKGVFGYSSEELLGKDFALLFPAAEYQRHTRAIRRFFVVDYADREASQMASALEVLGLRRNKEVVPVEVSFGNSRNVQGERLLTCIVRDLPQRKSTERKLRYLAYHDRLTDLGNRDLF